MYLLALIKKKVIFILICNRKNDRSLKKLLVNFESSPIIFSTLTYTYKYVTLKSNERENNEMKKYGLPTYPIYENMTTGKRADDELEWLLEHGVLKSRHGYTTSKEGEGYIHAGHGVALFFESLKELMSYVDLYSSCWCEEEHASE